MDETVVTTAETLDSQPDDGRANDGRVSRAARTREAVVDALLALIDRGNLRPTGREIADEAGVSLRSVYVHFEDVESLFVAAATRHGERMEALRGPCVLTGTLEERTASLIDRRRRIFEEGAQVRRSALLQEPFSPVLTRALELGRAAMRAEVEQVFAPELSATPDDEGRRLASVLDVATNAGTWECLRSHQHLSPDDAAALVHDMVMAGLRAWDQPTPAAGDHPPPSAPAGKPG